MGTTFELTDGINTYFPMQTDYISPSQMLITLETPVMLQGQYDIIATKSTMDTHTLANGFEVTGGIPYLETKVIMPDRMGYHWPQIVYIEYENTGQSSMPAPLLKLDMTDNALLSLDKTAQEAWWSGWSLNEAPRDVSDSIQVMAIGSGATPNILQPGDNGRIPVYYLGLKRPWNTSDRTIEATLEICDESNEDSVLWSEYKDAMKPQWWINEDAWNAVWQNYMDLAGNTWGEYIALLNSTRLPVIPLTGAFDPDYLKKKEQNVTRHLAMAFRMADGLSPIYNLAQATDVSIPTPGLPLSFSRIYQQPISRRYQLGSLGRGWRHNWQTSLSVNGDGDAAIYDITGTPRIFDKDGSLYIPSKGDHGTLTYSDSVYYVTELDGTVTAYNSNGTFYYIEDTNGNRITAAYSGSDLTSLSHSNGSQLLFTSSGGRITSVTDPRGVGTEDDYTVQFDYDLSDEYLSTVIEPGNKTTAYAYEIAGSLQQRHALKSVEYPDLTHQYFAYQTNGWLSSITKDGGAEPLTFTYDNKGGVTTTDAQNRTTTYTFDWTGQITQVKDDNGNKLTMVYDNDGKLLGMVGPEGQQYNYGYDTKDNIVAMKDALRKTINVAYESNHNQLSQITDPRNNSMSYDYDASGNLTEIAYADTTSEIYTYDTAGNVLTWTNRRGQTVTYTYNAAGLATSKDYDTTLELDFSYTYDEAGNITSANDPNGSTIMTYDPVTNWLTRIEYPGGKSLDFEYDLVGRRTRRTDQDGYYVDYSYTTLGKLDQITDPNSSLIVDYDYDTTGLLSQKTLGNGTYTTYAYDSAGNLTSLINYKPDASVISSFVYTYNASGLRTSETTLAGTRTYQYDANGQLVKVTYPDSSVTEYIYDSVGNRIRVLENGVPTDYTTNNLNQYEQVGNVSYTYDDDGNMASKTEAGVTTTYTYNIENRLIQVSTPTDTWTYTYDALGNRIATDHNGAVTNYLIDPAGYGNLIAEYDSVGNPIAKYEHGFGLISKTENSGDSYWYHFNAIGSTSEITADDAIVSNSYGYSPFGKILSETESVSNPFKYVGEFGIQREGNGLDYMRARFYLSETGRFNSIDPLGVRASDINFYRYASNAPTIMIDITGLECEYRWVNDYHRYIVTSDGWEYHFAPKNGKIFGDIGRRWRQRWNDNGDFEKEELGEGPRYNVLFYDNNCWGQAEADWNTYCAFYTNPVNRTNPNGVSGGNSGGGISHMTDPNRKLGPAGYGTSGYTPKDQLMTYTIEFENMSDATAPAHIIRVVDVLDESLDLDTFELVELAFANHTIIIPSGLKEYLTNYTLSVDNEYVSNSEITVQVDIKLDMSTREMTLLMVGVDSQTGWLPENILLGILYPNNETHRGDGHLSFNVELVEGLSSGTEIQNMASIFFDWNDPIDTPLVINTIDDDLPESMVNPLPANSKASVEISWSGTDASSGVAYYDVYVSTDGGDYELWLSNDPNTSEVFNAQPGHDYAFYSIAYDNIGHIEPAPVIPDTTTRLFYISDFDFSDDVDLLDLVTMAEQWLGTPGDPSADIAPIPPDGEINLLDFSKFAQEWLIGSQ